MNGSLKVFICGGEGCEAKTESARLPKGWKDVPGDGPTCPACMDGGWVNRCVRLQVAEVLGTVESGELVPTDYRGRFFEPFLAAWRMSTDLANWSQRELLAHDCRRLPGMTRLPPFAPLNLYRRWNEVCPPELRRAWDGCTQAAAAVIRGVEIRWKAERFGVLWLGNSSACTFRFPHPCAVPGQSVRFAWQDRPGGRRPTVSLLLPGVGRVVLRADGGRDWHRQLRDFSALADGSAVAGDVKVCGDVRNGKLSGVKLMCFGRFRRRAVEPTGKTAVVRTAADALLVVELPDRDPFVVRRPDLLGHLAAHERYREVRAVDLKHEKRWPARQRRRFVEGGQAANAKYANRVDTILKQAAACVAGFLRRQRADAVVYDDADQSYARGFRYFALRERVRQNCDTAGLRFQTLTEAQVDTAGGE